MKLNKNNTLKQSFFIPIDGRFFSVLTFIVFAKTQRRPNLSTKGQLWVQLFIPTKQEPHPNPPVYQSSLPFNRLRCGLCLVGMKSCTHNRPFVDKIRHPCSRWKFVLRVTLWLKYSLTCSFIPSLIISLAIFCQCPP